MNSLCLSMKCPILVAAVPIVPRVRGTLLDICTAMKWSKLVWRTTSISCPAQISESLQSFQLDGMVQTSTISECSPFQSVASVESMDHSRAIARAIWWQFCHPTLRPLPCNVLLWKLYGLCACRVKCSRVRDAIRGQGPMMVRPKLQFCGGEGKQMSNCLDSKKIEKNADSIVAYFVFPINATPRQRRRFMPPDRLWPYSLALAVKFSFFSKWLASYWTCLGVKPRSCIRYGEN